MVDVARVAHRLMVFYYLECVKKGIITVEEYMEMSDLYITPYYFWVKKQMKDVQS